MFCSHAEFVKNINKEIGTTIICNLHQIDLATQYSDRIIGLLDGSITFDKLAPKINKFFINEIYKH